MVRVLIFLFIGLSLFANSIKVAVAGNMAYAIKDIVKSFQKSYPNIKVDTIIGGSGKLTVQILRGAPFDVFLSADMKFPNILYKKGLAKTPPKVYAKGEIVFFSIPKIDSIEKIKNFSKIAIANPKTAPYGRAAMEFIKNAHLPILNKLVYAENVSQTFFYAMKVTHAGFIAKSAIYKTHKFLEIPKKYYRPIEQGAVLISNKKEAKLFYDFLFSQQTKNILKSYGYSI